MVTTHFDTEAFDRATDGLLQFFTKQQAEALVHYQGDETLRAIVMTNVLHHIPKISSLFHEANRCLVEGGKVILVEPWITDWSRLIYAHLHHEPVDPDASEWDFASVGPLSSANAALPWIVLCRDRANFEKDYPQLRITRIDPIMPFLYLLSGGFTSRIHFPGYSFPIWHKVDHAHPRLRRIVRASRLPVNLCAS